MNRLAAAIERTRAKLEELDAAKRAEIDANLALDFAEHFAYQQKQAEAHAMGKITPDEAQIMYIALGEVGSSENGGWAKGTDTATKYVVTNAVEQILSARLAARR